MRLPVAVGYTDCTVGAVGRPGCLQLSVGHTGAKLHDDPCHLLCPVEWGAFVAVIAVTFYSFYYCECERIAAPVCLFVLKKMGKWGEGD